MDKLAKVSGWILGLAYALIITVALVITGLVMAALYFPMKWLIKEYPKQEWYGADQN